MEMPSQEEQSIAEEYVLRRPLTRPDTDVKKAIKYGVIYIFATLLVGVTFLLMFNWLGVFSYFPPKTVQFKNEHPFWFHFLYFIVVFVITALCCSKIFVIGCIRLYQHYAPEDVRRRCLFKPTCSEYSIMAIKKYGLIIGLIKAYIRIFKKCKGNIYRIEYP